ncbi:hypothetical protein JYU34_007440, partial [Plutella xylostella]
ESAACAAVPARRARPSPASTAAAAAAACSTDCRYSSISLAPPAAAGSVNVRAVLPPSVCTDRAKA